MREQGIWYPGVWDDYIEAKANEKLPTSIGEEILQLEGFRGYRKKEMKIEVEEATVHRGEWIAITGENGAGKSTLLHALMQFIKTRGTYVLQGKAVKRMPQELTFVFQNPEFQFVTNSVYDEIAFGLKLAQHSEEEVNEKVEELLSRFHLKAFRNHHPYQLSMGQKRRLSVATSLVNDHRILLLDEPTFGQDSRNTFALLEMLQAYQQEGTTILMVTHDQKIVEHFATRVWKIEDGSLVGDHLVEQENREPVLECL